MFVGETGIGRVVQRTCELMKEHDTDEVGRYGGIDLKLTQKYLNFHYSVSLDLFGAELSTNAANYFSMGLKGRFSEEARDDDHQLRNTRYTITQVDNMQIVQKEQPALLALNETLRDAYIADCARGVGRWNKVIKTAGIDFELRLPHRGFHRAIGDCAAMKVSPEGRIIAEAEWDTHHGEWLPTDAEREFVSTLMRGVTEPGKFAGWIAPPARGINHQGIEFEYVKLG